jgi:hypothetical protein
MALPATFTDTLTELANLALEDIGEAPKDFLTDPVFDDNTGLVAEVVQRHMYVVIREAETDYTWDALLKPVILTSPEDLTEDETYVWGYRYPLPDDFLRPIFDESFSYEIEGGFIYCDVMDDLRFKYHRYSIDPAEWPSTLLAVVRGKLGIAICMPITENEKKLEQIIALFERLVLPRAQRVDAYGKKRPNSRFKRQVYSRTRGRRNYGADDRRNY